jgi:hypothetical protein
MATCFVCFRSGQCDIPAAEGALLRSGLTVTRQGDQLFARRPGSPEFRVLIDRGDSVRAEAAEMAEGTAQAAAMRECDARFEISFDSLDEALDEINTLMEVQAALQEVARGYLFLPWNGNLVEPPRG